MAYSGEYKARKGIQLLKVGTNKNDAAKTAKPIERFFFWGGGGLRKLRTKNERMRERKREREEETDRRRETDRQR